MFGAEKSFIVISSSADLQSEWVTAIKTAKMELLKKLNNNNNNYNVDVGNNDNNKNSITSSAVELAPLWVNYYYYYNII